MPKENMGAVEVLKMLRADVQEMELHSLDGHVILVAKADVLGIIQDWIEQALNPELNEATG